VNLLTKVFENITDQQLTVLKVKTGKQRMDSTQIASHILEMSRLKLLVEAVQRMQRSLSEGDQQRYTETLAPYLQGTRGRMCTGSKAKRPLMRTCSRSGK